MGTIPLVVVIGLGTVWILDGLEVSIVGSMSEALKPEDTGLGMSDFDIGLAGAIYVAGACLGALVFGQLTDRYGRKKISSSPCCCTRFGYYIGAGLMIIGGVVESVLGVRAEGQPLESLARPLTAEDADDAGSDRVASAS